MKFELALEVQAQVFREVFNFVEVPAAAGMTPLPGLFVDSAPTFTSDAPRKQTDDIALGVAAGQNDEDSRLAVLLQDEAIQKSEIVSRILALAKDEAEVLYIGRQEASWTQVRNNPIRLGCSASPVTVGYAGTMGCFAKDGQTGHVGVLSNNHVLADVNRVALQTPIMQPGALDNGNPGQDAVAVLTRFVPIQFGGTPNAVDAAFATILQHGRQEDRATLYNSANVPAPAIMINPSSIGSAMPGMTVFKTGRTTRHTRGRVRAVNVNNYQVNMGVGIARFDNQILIEMDNTPVAPFSRPGDSGSLIVDGNGQPVGLLFAGSNIGGAGNVGITGCNPISSVLTQLGISLV